MSSEAGLMRAVIANPEDDTPRLVYADWLDEAGDHIRAEFIRIQCELAGVITDPERRKELQDQERKLLYANKAAWSRLGSCEFRRGIGEKITLSAAELRENIDPFLTKITRGYAIMAVRITGIESSPVNDVIRTVFGHPRQNLLTEDEQTVLCTELAERKELTRLFELDFSDSTLDQRLLDMMQASRHLFRIKVLNLERARLTRLQFLEGPASLLNIRRLLLAGNRIGVHGSRDLISNRMALKHLEELDLSNNNIRDREAIQLAEAFPRLRYCNLSGNQISPSEGEEIKLMLENAKVII
jgi:uncharacterized protein (TIGR02996 family)